MNSTKKSHNVFAHSPSLQILWKCASQRRFVTKTLINSINWKTIFNEVFNYINSKTRRRSPLALILDSHLMLGLVYIYSKNVVICQHDVEKLYKDAVVQRFFEFEVSTKSKLTRKKDAILSNVQWQIDIDENLLPDERVLLERDFSIEIRRESTPPLVDQLEDNFPPLPWEISAPTHGKRITLLPDIEEPMPKFDLIDDRFGEPLPISTMDVDLPQQQIDLLPSDLPQIENEFLLDALTFFNNSLDVYPRNSSENFSTKSILLGVDCSLSGDVPLIVIQEATTINVDEVPMPMEIAPIDDQRLPVDDQVETEKNELHMSKKRRHAVNAINRKRKYPSLFNQIVQFDFENLNLIREENDQIWKRRQDEEIPWPMLVGRDGKKRMEILLEKAKKTVETADLKIMIDDVTKIAEILTNPNETEGLAQARRTGEEIAIRRGQTSGLLPKAASRSPSFVPTVQDRVSQIPDGEILPTFPSGFDEIPLNVPPSISPRQTSRRDRRIPPTISAEPSPTWKDKQKQKAIDDLLNLAENSTGGSFQNFLFENQTNRIGAARLFSVLLVLCAERRIRPAQEKPFADIRIFSFEPMENDENHF